MNKNKESDQKHYDICCCRACAVVCDCQKCLKYRESEERITTEESEYMENRKQYQRILAEINVLVKNRQSGALTRDEKEWRSGERIIVLLLLCVHNC